MLELFHKMVLIIYTIITKLLTGFEKRILNLTFHHYEFLNQETNPALIEFSQLVSAKIHSDSFFKVIKGQLISEWLFGVFNFPKSNAKS